MGQNFKEKKRSKGQMRVICALFRTKNCSYHYTRHLKMMRVRQIRVISSQFFQCCSIENTHCPNFTEYWLWSERDWSWHSPLIISGTSCRWHCSLSGRLNVNKQLLSSPSISDFRQQPTFIIVISCRFYFGAFYTDAIFSFELLHQERKHHNVTVLPQNAVNQIFWKEHIICTLGCH